MENLQIYEEFKITASLRERVSYLGDVIRNNFYYPLTLISDKALEEVVNMGVDIIPYLIEDLRNKKNYTWTTALKKITKIIPYKNPKCSKDFVDSWINWYDKEYEEWLREYKNNK